jgi:hypothetical protein
MHNLLRSLAPTLVAAALSAPALAAAPAPESYFERIATFPVFRNDDIATETVAEIVAASEDGNTLIYTDSENDRVGFIDIGDPEHPAPLGVLDLAGEPTSVAVHSGHALVAVNTSADFVDTSGELAVIDIASRALVATLPLGGQPDSVAVSPDGRYAAVAIENERDEDLGDGAPPQLPAGWLAVFDLVGGPADWTQRRVELTGLAERFPEDPEPEYVAINAANIAVVSLQENNHLALVHLPSGRVLRHFSAGAVDLEGIDVEENDLIEPTASLPGTLREPDGVTWLHGLAFATANEGDLEGGSRGFSVFGLGGQLLFDSGNGFEHQVIRAGHYPEDRSENKGNEPENVAFARYGSDRLLFVGSERANLVGVYRLRGLHHPELLQLLPTGVGPEGLLPIPARDLLVAASENDDRGDGFRSVLTLYRKAAAQPDYPTLVSGDRADGTPRPWGALSALAADPGHAARAYSVHDSFYRNTRIYTLDLSATPARIDGEIPLRDAGGLLAAVAPGLVEASGAVNLDAEGLATRAGGGFWLVSEGKGTGTTPNLLLAVAADGVIEQVVPLPASTAARQTGSGFEGVAATGAGAAEQVYVAFQREWQDDPAGRVRIGRYTPADGSWRFFHYPLDAVASPFGGWIGLSEIVALDADSFAVIERDNRAGADARVKRLYRFSVAGVDPLEDTAPGIAPSFPVLAKTLVADLLPALEATGGAVLEKIEGLAALPGGDALIVTDNDGVDDSSGETQLLRLPGLFY